MQGSGPWSNMHGLRRWLCPSALSGADRREGSGRQSFDTTTDTRTNSQDQVARQTISRELGHERQQITTVYLGR